MSKVSVAKEMARKAPYQQIEKKEYVPISGVMLVTLGKIRIVKLCERVWEEEVRCCLREEVVREKEKVRKESVDWQWQ